MNSTVMEIKKENSPETICRLCFTEREKYRLIHMDEHSLLHEWIENLTTLKIMNVPNAPASLCLECEKTLQKFEAFREMCFTNDRVFKELFIQDELRNEYETLEDVMPVSQDVPKIIKIGESKSHQMHILSFAIDSKEDKSDIKLEWSDIDVAATSVLNSEKNEPIQGVDTERSHRNAIVEDCYSLLDNLSKQTQLNTNERTYICDWCNKGFRRSYHLKVHLRIHTQERPYMCNKCNRSFNAQSNLARHIRSPYGCKPYACEFCDAKYTQHSQLEHHKVFYNHIHIK